MNTELSGIELRKAVAEKLGWTDLSVFAQTLYGRYGDEHMVPVYDQSVDICLRDLSPRIQETGYRILIIQTSKGWDVMLVASSIEGQGKDLAEAICRAFLGLP